MHITNDINIPDIVVKEKVIDIQAHMKAVSQHIGSYMIAQIYQSRRHSPSHALIGRYIVSFTMPAKYKSTEDLPEPKNPNVRLREVPGAKMAAISWR